MTKADFNTIYILPDHPSTDLIQSQKNIAFLCGFSTQSNEEIQTLLAEEEVRFLSLGGMISQVGDL